MGCTAVEVVGAPWVAEECGASKVAQAGGAAPSAACEEGSSDRSRFRHGHGDEGAAVSGRTTLVRHVSRVMPADSEECELIPDVAGLVDLQELGRRIMTREAPLGRSCTEGRANRRGVTVAGGRTRQGCMEIGYSTGIIG